MSSSISIGTTDWSLAGTYNFKINFSDVTSGLTDTSVTFTIIVKIMDAASITIATTPGNQVYRIFDTML
jgi:hypothetical protein